MKLASKIFYNLIRFPSFLLFWLCYRPKVYGRENIPKKGGIIFAGNHKHALDPLLVAMSTYREICFLAKSELFVGVKKYFFRALGAISINLEGNNPQARKDIETLLNNGGAVNIFPEAKRNFTNELLLPFKYGAVSLAKKTGANIVPLAIKGEYRWFRRGIYIVYGAPFTIGNMDLDCANALLRKKIAELLLGSIK